MKVLVIGFFAPPYATMGAIRLGKLVKYFSENNHDIRVVSVNELELNKTLPIEFDSDLITYTSWFDVNFLPRAVTYARRINLGKSISKGKVSDYVERKHDKKNHILGLLGRAYGELFFVPDKYVGWIPFGYVAARRLIKQWEPDIIFATSPPRTALLLGLLCGLAASRPWVAELRDRWGDDPYFERWAWRGRLDAWLERMVLSRADGLVSVSEPWVHMYRERYGKPTKVIYNGFDPADYENDLAPQTGPPQLLNIVYTGLVYPGRRDPSPLFEAIERLGNAGEAVAVQFYGTDPNHVLPLATRHGVEAQIRVYPHVPYRESLALQKGADVLLLMQWNDPREQGNVPGKLFEYLASRRPILGIGIEDGVPANIVRQRGAGLYSNDPVEIMKKLEEWVETKRSRGHVPETPEHAAEDFSRDEQFRELCRFLESVVSSRPKA